MYLCPSSAPKSGVQLSMSSVNPRTEGVAKAKFNFDGKTPMELSLVKGNLVVGGLEPAGIIILCFIAGEQLNLVRRVDQNWYEARIGNRRGIVPVSYVAVTLEPGPATTTTRGTTITTTKGKTNYRFLNYLWSTYSMLVH
jgi:hypothetical protein